MSSEIQSAPISTPSLNPGDKKLYNGQDKLGKEELRRMMYERIAQGNKLAEAEELARREIQR